ncbi:hypothetical protein DSO57_1003906 [Entomophthora muscae]|uniref:Uncharacterized protein n=1 Tax=Entomophthora muscae TaxID=34485 RepID=A0ACC2SA63_9FUNG|nr:hypothetical protein DSO57_1003906 [Entomophthora muscae]
MASRSFPNACVLHRHQTHPEWKNFQSLFQRLSLLKVISDFNSTKNRRDSLELGKYQDCFDKMDVAMMAVSHQLTGSDEFIKHTNWQGELYLDINHEVCRKATGSSTKSFIKRQTTKLGSWLHRKQKRSRALFKLGGTYVVTPDFKVIYAHEPKASSDFPNVSFLLNLCRSYVEASHPAKNSFLPVFAHLSPSLQPKPQNWDSSEPIPARKAPLPSRVMSSQFYLNDDFTSIFG